MGDPVCSCVCIGVHVCAEYVISQECAEAQVRSMAMSHTVPPQATSEVDGLRYQDPGARR